MLLYINFVLTCSFTFNKKYNHFPLPSVLFLTVKCYYFSCVFTHFVWMLQCYIIQPVIYCRTCGIWVCNQRWSVDRDR